MVATVCAGSHQPFGRTATISRVTLEEILVPLDPQRHSLRMVNQAKSESEEIRNGLNSSTFANESLGTANRACRTLRSRVKAALQSGDALLAATIRHGCAGCGKTGMSPSPASAATAAVRTTRIAAVSPEELAGVCAPAVTPDMRATPRKNRDMTFVCAPNGN